MTESGLQLAFVTFLENTSNSKAYWYSPLHLPNDTPSGIKSLPELIGLSFDSLLHFFKLIWLAKDLGQKHGLKFMPDNFEGLLLEEHNRKHLSEEVTSIQSKQLKGRSNGSVSSSNTTSKHIFIRLGLNNIPAIVRKPGKTDVAPPWISDIRHHRSHFHETVATLLKKAQHDNEKEILLDITEQLSSVFCL